MKTQDEKLQRFTTMSIARLKLVVHFQKYTKYVFKPYIHEPFFSVCKH